MADHPPAWQPSDFSAAAERRPDGSIRMQPNAPLSAYPTRVTDALEQWVTQDANRTLVARRGADGDWIRVSYGDAWQRIRSLAAGLAELDLGAERPLLILSGNSIEHLLLALAAMYAGIPYCPVSPAYSRAAPEFEKLRYVVDLLTPGLVATFAEPSHGAVIEDVVPPATPVLGDAGSLGDRRVITLAELADAEPAAAERAHAAVTADTIAKFLLTSGSTGQPKPVITTQRMLCSNQVMLRYAMPFVADDPPVLVDWLPWNHTFGGSHNVGLVLFNGGTLYIDDGRPLPGAFDETVRNLREIAPSVYFNVPKGFELLAAELHRDDALRHNFYSRLRACLFAGAGLTQHTWNDLEGAAARERSDRVPMLSGLGCTEASPSITFTTPGNERAGGIGLPAPGNELKLVPVEDKLELRVRGPNVTPGYWRLSEPTRAAFDDEGYYCLGDAVRLVDPEDPTGGMIFDGRIAEDFKLASGTWVSIGPLRASLLEALAPLARDVVIAGLNRDYIAILIVPDLPACTELVDDGDAPPEKVYADPAVRQRIETILGEHSRANRGSSRHARRAIILTEPLSLDRGEITDKGSVNQRAVLSQRADLVEALYAEEPQDFVLIAA